MSSGNTKIGIFPFICIIADQFIVSIIFLYPHITVNTFCIVISLCAFSNILLNNVIYLITCICYVNAVRKIIFYKFWVIFSTFSLGLISWLEYWLEFTLNISASGKHMLRLYNNILVLHWYAMSVNWVEAYPNSTFFFLLTKYFTEQEKSVSLTQYIGIYSIFTISQFLNLKFGKRFFYTSKLLASGTGKSTF